MNVVTAIKQRLSELNLEQRDLAQAAQVTESYISHLLTGRRAPPAPNRTDIYDRMDQLLKLPRGQLAQLAARERKERLRSELGDQPAPLYSEVRALVLRKCHPARERAVRAIFERQPFGELEHMVTRTLLELVKRVARHELEQGQWLRGVARLSGRSYREMRVVALEFLDTDILHISPENCVAFLDPIVASWDIDLVTYEFEITLNPAVSHEPTRRFGFSELPERRTGPREPGLAEFLKDRALSATATSQEIAFLDGLRFTTGRPTALYFYRELQSLRDPLHFAPEPPPN